MSLRPTGLPRVQGQPELLNIHYIFWFRLLCHINLLSDIYNVTQLLNSTSLRCSSCSNNLKFPVISPCFIFLFLPAVTTNIKLFSISFVHDWEKTRGITTWQYLFNKWRVISKIKSIDCLNRSGKKYIYIYILFSAIQELTEIVQFYRFWFTGEE